MAPRGIQEPSCRLGGALPRAGATSALSVPPWILLLPLGLLFGCAHSPDAVEPDPGVEDEEEYVATPPIPRPVEPEPVEEVGTMLEEAEPEAAEPDAPEPPPAEPDMDPAAVAAFEAGVRAAEEADWESAEQGFAEAAELDPSSKWAWYNLGVARERGGDVRGAIDAWEEALDLKRGFSPAAVNISRAMVRQGRASQAERMLRVLIQQSPENLDLRNELARVMVAQGTPAKLDAAFAEARQVLSTDEQNVGALLVLGRVFFAQDRFELAEWVSERVLAHEPDNPAAHQLMGFLHLRQGERREAFSSFQRAARGGGEYAEMYVNYGAFLNQAQDFDAALEQLEKAVKYAPNMVEARLNLGNAYRGAGRYPEALAEYERVRELDPDNADALLNMALVYLDAPLEEMETLPRLERARTLLASYSEQDGEDDRLDDFVRDAERAIDVERRRIEREELRRVREEEQAKKEAEEEAARLAEEEAARVEEEEAARRAAEEAEAARVEEEEAARRAAEEADSARRAEEEEARAAEAETARREAEEAFRRRRAEEEDARREEAERAARMAEEAARADEGEPEGSRLGDEEEEEKDEEDGGSRLDSEAGAGASEEPGDEEGTLLGGDGT